MKVMRRACIAVGRGVAGGLVRAVLVAACIAVVSGTWATCVSDPLITNRAPTVWWDEVAETPPDPADGFTIYWRYVGETSWRICVDLPVWFDDGGWRWRWGLEGGTVGWPLGRCLDIPEDEVVQVMVTAWYTSGLESEASNVIEVCLPRYWVSGMAYEY